MTHKKKNSLLVPDFFFQYWLKSFLVIYTHRAQMKSPLFICALWVHQLQHVHIPQGSTNVYNWYIFYVGFIRPLVLRVANCMLTTVNIRFQRASSCVNHRSVHVSSQTSIFAHPVQNSSLWLTIILPSCSFQLPALITPFSNTSCEWFVQLGWPAFIDGWCEVYA